MLAFFLLLLGIILVFGTETITWAYLYDLLYKIAGGIALFFSFRIMMLVIDSLKRR